MYTNDQDLMVKALLNNPELRKAAYWENDDFAPQKLWQEDYPLKQQEYQQHLPMLQALTGQRLAGDVVPLPITPAPTAGPTARSADYATGKMQDTKIAPMDPLAMEQWYRNMVRIRRGY